MLKSRKPIYRALRLALTSALFCTPLTVLAQDNANTEKATSEVVNSSVKKTDEKATTKKAGNLPMEEVITTGTLIKGLDLGGAVQAIQMDRKTIMDTGAQSAADLMKELTQTVGGNGTFNNSTGGPLSGQTPVGAGAVSLRGLGSSSTLTLVNGRRSSVSSFANGQESFIDINSIPASAIERVEVLPSGASATYGADAVAGVVNVILREDFEGAEVSTSYGDSLEGTDEGRYNINGVFGASTDKTHTMLIVDYYNRNAFYDRDRSYSKDSVRPSQQGIFPSFNDLYAQYNDQTESPQNGGCPANQFKNGAFGEYCELDTNDYSSIEGNYESLGTVGSFKVFLNDNLTWKNELMYQRYKSDGASSPAAFDSAPIDPENPYWPTSLQNDIVAEAQRAFDEGDQDNFRPNDFQDFYGFPIYAWGRFTDPRSVDVENQSARLVSSLEGKFTNDWNWETGVTYGMSKSEQEGNEGLYVSNNFYDLLLGNRCTDGSSVNRWDVDLQKPDASYNGDTCEDSGKQTLWYNPFGGQGNQAAGVNEAIRTKAQRDGDSKLWALDGVVSGELMQLPAGALSAAFGAELRHEAVEDTPDAIATSTTLNPNPVLGFSSTSADADRDQYALFSEFVAPVTEQLELQLAGRYDHYDDFGGDFNPKVAFSYKAVEEVTLRGNWSTSFRAPSLAQSGAGVLLSSYTVDCQETPAACDNDADEEGNSLLSEDVANPDLDAEEATTWGYGLVFKPSDDTEFMVDYWNIKHEDLVGIDEDDFIRRALAGAYPVVGEGELDTGLAGLEVRNGFVVDAHFQLTNLGEQRTDGVDFSATHYIELANDGLITLMFDATYVNEFDITASETSGTESNAGEYQYPRWIAQPKIRWSQGPWSTSLSARYTHHYMDDPSTRTLTAVGLPDDAQVEVDSWTVFDASVSYDINEQNNVRLNVDNIFDRDPPQVLATGANVDYVNHNSYGTFVTMRYTYKF